MTGVRPNLPLPLPRRVIRKLLRTGWFRARRVLDVGCGDGRLVQFLQSAGYQAAGIDDRPQTAASGVRDVHLGSLAGGFPFRPHAFDAVLVRESRIYSGDLTSPEALIATANVLSSVAPQRRTVFLATNLHGDASLDIWLNAMCAHLANFPVSVDVSRYEDGWERYLSLEWLIGRNRHVDLLLLTATVPRKPISRLSWHQAARAAVLKQTGAVSERAA